MTVDDLAQEIRRVDGSNSLGAGALAEALMPFILRAVAAERERATLAERERAIAICSPWMKRDHLTLHAGECTAQEFRTVVAVLKSVKAILSRP